MSEVWVVWPTVHPGLSHNMVQVWKARGYKTAVLMNPEHQGDTGADVEIIQPKWKGFPAAVNVLCHAVGGEVVVVVGDDVFPSKEHTAHELLARFLDEFPDTFGVVQPTGDGFASENICAVSPWIGRTFIEEAYGGQGPFHEGYYHYYSDHELQKVAEGLGCFSQWDDVTQFHDHWQRQDKPKRPKHLKAAERSWSKDMKLFKNREARGFPGMGPPHVPKENLKQVEAWVSWRKRFTSGQAKRESVSGHGSSLENTKEIREALPGIFERFCIKIFTDVPCGDWNWMKEVDLSRVDYLGLDVIPAQIRDNRKQFPGVRFQVSNLTTDVPRRSDLILCRDLLFHLSNDLALQCLKNLKASGSKWLLTTTFPSLPGNRDLSLSVNVGWRQVNLCRPPFNLPEPVEVIQENDSDACRGRVVALFDLEAM